MPMPGNRVEVFLPLLLVEALDEWRRSQRDLPSRGEAMRRLLAAGLVDELTRTMAAALVTAPTA